MRVISLSVIFISVITVFAFVNAFPTDNNHVRQNTLSDVYEIIPDKTQDFVLPGETSTSRRVKRADIIGFIRQICPPLANFINQVYERVKKIVFKIIGSLLLGGGNKNKTTGGGEKPGVVVNLPTYPPEEETTEPVTDSSSSSEDSSSSTESTSSSDSSSTKTSTSSQSFSSENSSPSSDNSLADTTSSTSETASSTTKSHSTGQMNSISTNELQIDELTDDNDYHYDC